MLSQKEKIMISERVLEKLNKKMNWYFTKDYFVQCRNCGLGVQRELVSV
jgi:hypothetical protein